MAVKLVPYVSVEDLEVPTDDPQRVWDSHKERHYSLPPGKTIDDLKAFVPLLNEAYRSGTETGRYLLQADLKKLLDL